MLVELLFVGAAVAEVDNRPIVVDSLPLEEDTARVREDSNPAAVLLVLHILEVGEVRNPWEVVGHTRQVEDTLLVVVGSILYLDPF